MATNTDATDATGTGDDEREEAPPSFALDDAVVARWVSQIKTSVVPGGRKLSPGDAPALLTIEQAAGRLHVSRRTFYRLRDTYDDFPRPVRFLVRGVRYYESDIDAFALRRLRGR